MYEDMVACGDVSQLAMVGGQAIAAIGCRLQMKENGGAKLYILTLGVLAPYRNEGIGALRSGSFLAEISVTSPRKVFIFLM